MFGMFGDEPKLPMVARLCVSVLGEVQKGEQQVGWACGHRVTSNMPMPHMSSHKDLQYIDQIPLLTCFDPPESWHEDVSTSPTLLALTWLCAL
jgi:hypothetical protein